jgi:hypothetical protein
MAVWTLMPVYKKSIQEVEFWTKDGKVIQYNVWWRGGSVTLTTATDAAPEIDLENADDDGLDVYSLVDGENILDVEMDSFWDGDNSEWLANSPDVTEEELQEVIDAWEEDFSEGVENLGWEQDDTEVYFHGELSLEQVVEN